MIGTEDRTAGTSVSAAGRLQPMPPETGKEFVLTFHCPDALGIVQAVAAFLLDQ